MTMRCTLPPEGRAAEAAVQHRAALPVLETARLTLRAPRLDDFSIWVEVYGEEEGGYLGGPLSDEDVWLSFTNYVSGWLLHGHGLFTVERSGEAIGFVTLGLEWGDEEPEIGWLLPKRMQGQGYATEAAMAVRDYAVALYGPGKTVSYIHAENARSQAVAARLGAARDTLDEARLGCQVWRHGGAA